MRARELLLSSTGPITAIQSYRATPDQKGRALSPFRVKAVLRELRRDDAWQTLIALAELAGGIEPNMPSRSSTLKLVELVEVALESGRLLLVEGWSFGRRTESWEGRQMPAALAAPGRPVLKQSQPWQRAQKADIEVRFIESGSGRPLANASFLVRAPDGSESELLTSSAGAVSLTGLDPGQCAVVSIIKDATVATSYAVASGGTVDPSAHRDSRPLGPAAKELYPKMYRYFEEQGVEIKSVGGTLLWDNVRETSLPLYDEMMNDALTKNPHLSGADLESAKRAAAEEAVEVAKTYKYHADAGFNVIVEAKKDGNGFDYKLTK